jgi:hypothetical protein
MGTPVASPARATTHGLMGPRRGNEAAAHNGVTRWSSSARVAPRRLATAPDFILQIGSVCGSSEGSPATKWPQAGATASPRARGSFDSHGIQRKLKLERGLGFLTCGWKSQR